MNGRPGVTSLQSSWSGADMLRAAAVLGDILPETACAAVLVVSYHDGRGGHSLRVVRSDDRPFKAVAGFLRHAAKHCARRRHWCVRAGDGGHYG